MHVDVFDRLVAAKARVSGVPNAREIYVPVPMTNRSPGELRAYIEANDPVHRRPFMEALFDALTRPVAPEDLRGQGFDRSTPRLLEADTEANLHGVFQKRCWTDFLPIVLPTEERVEAMLKGTSHPSNEVVGQLRPTDGWEAWEFDVEKVAVNAVMAGAEPQHFPVVLALAASGDTARQCSMSSMGRMVVANGPIRDEIGMNSGIGAMGPYNHANAVIGRAYGLLSQNLQGGSVPGFSYQGSQGNQLNYNSCTFAENEERSPFDPFHVRQGFAKGDSTVSVFSVWGMVWIEHLKTYWEEKLATLLAGLEPSFGVTFVVDPIVARELVERGLDHPDKLASWVHRHVRIPARRYWDHVTLVWTTRPLVYAGVEPYASYRKADPEALVPVFEPDRVNLVVAGGETNGYFNVYMGSPIRRRRGADPNRTATVSVDEWR